MADPKKIRTILNRDSGLLGISEKSSDMRDILAVSYTHLVHSSSTVVNVLSFLSWFVLLVFISTIKLIKTVKLVTVQL